jgi:hypothetical protein
METTTATSTYRSLTVTINSRGYVHTTKGVLLGDREGMELLGWEFN